VKKGKSDAERGSCRSGAERDVCKQTLFTLVPLNKNYEFITTIVVVVRLINKIYIIPFYAKSLGRKKEQKKVVVWSREGVFV
jgi:hypothetical protein